MNTYYCKCGRIVQKGVTADNTGNRDVDGCDGCPYLLPWGPSAWDEARKAFVQDVKGQECRMSKDIEYATQFCGSVQDKCTCYIASLDFEFLERVSNWIAENYPNREIFGSFCRADIRPTEYVSNGRYRMSISCVQNKKGMAAKAALLERFFNPDGSRKDMDPAAEKRLILDRIEAGKAAANKKEEPLEAKHYQNEYGTIFAVQKKAGAPRLMCRVEEGSSWVISGVLAARTGDAKTADELQAVLDRAAEELGWTECTNTYAPNGDAVATTGANAASAESTEETSTTSESGADANTSTSATSSRHAETSTLAPGSPAGAAPAPSIPSGAAAASTQAAFDYSGLDAQTVFDLHLAEREYSSGKRMAEMGLRRMADGVAIAHEALRITDATICRNGGGQFSKPDQTFGRWCDSVGLNRKAAERLLQVSNLFDASTPREQKLLDELSPSLLYAAAKPSAPAELVQAVKDGDITTHKQYQDLLAQYNAEKAAREHAEHERDEAVTHIQAARDMQIDTARERDTALKEKAALARDCNRLGLTAEKAQAERDNALRRATEAEKARDGARDALKAAKMRGDKLKAENDALKARPIEVLAASPDEVERMADQKAHELLRVWQEEQPGAEDSTREAYDAVILAERQMDTTWKMLCPHIARLDPGQRSTALNQLLQKLMYIKEEICRCL